MPSCLVVLCIDLEKPEGIIEWCKLHRITTKKNCVIVYDGNSNLVYGTKKVDRYIKSVIIDIDDKMKDKLRRELKAERTIQKL